MKTDPQSARIGMWLFLFTEMILFGGLFLLYAVYRATYALDFHAAGAELNVALGVLNTVILLTSSLTMALSITAVRKGDKKLGFILLCVTVALAGVFLIDKYFEWGAKIHHGLYPSGPGLAALPKGQVLFYGLYFTMTGLHGLHVLAGAVLLAVMAALLRKGRIAADKPVALENSGLYWHLVDVVWIFILPLFYLAV